MKKRCTHCKLEKVHRFSHYATLTDASRPNGKKRLRVFVDEFLRPWSHGQCNDCKNLKVRQRHAKNPNRKAPPRGPVQKLKWENGALVIEERSILPEERDRLAPGLKEQEQIILFGGPIK
jgi:hypothetical protein